MPQFDFSGNPDDLRIGPINQYGNRRYLSKEDTAAFLSRTLDRLKSEIGSYIASLKEHNIENANAQIGFFSLTRLLFTEIEGIDKIMYEEGRHRLLRELGLEYPEIATQLFRNSLIHNSNPVSIRVGYTRITWAIGLQDIEHWFKSYEELGLEYHSFIERRTDHNFRYYIDMYKLYNSLVEVCEAFLDSEEDGASLVPFEVKFPRVIRGSSNKRHKGLLLEIDNLKEAYEVNSEEA